MENNQELIAQCEARAKQWLTPAYDEDTRKEVQAMLSIRIWNLVQAVCVAQWVSAPTE